MCSYCRSFPAILAHSVSKPGFRNAELAIRSMGSEFVFTLNVGDACVSLPILDGKIDWSVWVQVYRGIKDEADFMCNKVMELKAFI
jgi:hypothetical protein